jgi:hypothetical protein
VSRAPNRRGRAVTVLMLVTLAAVLAAALWVAIGAVDHSPVHLTIDGERVLEGFELASLAPSERIALAIGLTVLLLAATVVVPVVLALAMTGLLLAVFSVVGLPLLFALAVLTLLLSPIALLVWVIWRALRPPNNIAR